MLRRFARTVWLGRCPSCGQTSMFRGLGSLVEACSACGLRYDAGEGASMGSIQIGYVAGVKFALILIAVELIWGPIAAVGLDPLLPIMALSTLATLAVYRPSKALWVLVLFRFGWLRWSDGRPSDEPRETPPLPLAG